MSHRLLQTVCNAALAVTLAALAQAQVLDEGARVVAVNATNTPGDSDSVYRITQSGSYYLESVLNGVSGKHGIEIDANDVTLELNGFPLVGVGGSLNGVTVVGARRNIAVRGGVVQGFGGRGIDAGQVNGGSFEELILQGNGSTGLELGSECVATRIVAIGNAIAASGRTQVLVQDCIASGASFVFGASDDCTLLRCSSTSGGYSVGTRGVVKQCKAYLGGVGFMVKDRCSFQDCQVDDSSSNGFESAATSLTTFAGEASRFERCTTRGAGWRGFQLLNDAGRSVFDHCMALNSDGSGFLIYGASVFEGCIAKNNDVNGFSVFDGPNLLRGCHAEGNQEWGITGGNGSRVVGSSSFDNDLGGVSAGVGCVVEGNFVVEPSRGYGGGANILFVRNVSVRFAGIGFITHFGAPPGVAHGPLVLHPGGVSLSFVAGAEHPQANLFLDY